MIMTEQEKDKNKLKKRIGKKIRKITFMVIKPFLPFIIVILLIILAVSTVSDAIFGKEDDKNIEEKLSSKDYEAQYEEWIEETDGYTTIISDARGLVPTDMFIWPVPNYTTITSPFGMRVHPVTRYV